MEEFAISNDERLTNGNGVKIQPTPFSANFLQQFHNETSWLPIRAFSALPVTSSVEGIFRKKYSFQIGTFLAVDPTSEGA